jgi:hypothetical protein
MGEAAIDVFGYGLAAGLSPVALIATVVLLTSGSGRSNGLLFMAGFVLTIAAITTATLLIADRLAPAQGNQTAETLLELGIGLILLVAAWTERPGRDPAEGGGSRSKRLFAKLDDVSAPVAFGIGALLVVLPKRLAITVLAGLVISSARLDPSEDLVLDGLYVLTASALVWLTVLVAIVSGPRAEPLLVSVKTWLLANAQAVVFVVSLAFGVLFTGSAILDLIL